MVRLINQFVRRVHYHRFVHRRGFFHNLNFQSMELIHSKSAGIDIGSEELYVSIGDGEVSKFGTFTQDIEELRDYLISNSIVTVAMEATGIYWINLYEVLAEAGIDVWLVDGKETKQVPGRKSDVKDCQWICLLYTSDAADE